MNNHLTGTLELTHLPSDAKTDEAKAAARASGVFLETAFQIPSHTDFIAPAVDKIVRRIRKAQCVPGKESDIAMALFEALANAVIHGNHRDVTKPVQILCRYEPRQCVSIIVTDEGAGFDPGGVPDPTRSENIAADHGRGIFMMRAFMDDVWYEKGGREVHLLKKCDGPVQTLLKSYVARAANYARARRARRRGMRPPFTK